VRLGIDGKRLIQARTGPARWLEHMLRHWASVDLPFAEVRCYTPGPTEHSWARPPKLQHVPLSGRLSPILWENTVLRSAARGDDVLFGASYTIPLGYRKRSVVSIQGIYEGPHAERGPWWYRWRFSALYRASAHRAQVVLANSQSTRDDLVRYYGVDPGKIRIIYQGVGVPFVWSADRERVARAAGQVVGQGPYFVFVGKMSERRHVPELVRAFAEGRWSMPVGTRLVLVGPNHVGLPLDRCIAEAGVTDAVTHLPHLDQERLATVYAGALAFVLPTTHEGLSATILEAMACGTPVLTVEHAPLHEGFAESCMVLERPEHGLMRDALVRLAQEEALRDRLSALGRACAARFTWRQTAEQTMAVLWEVARS